MKQKPENPPAFPHLNPNYDGNWNKEPQRSGMMLKDYFAAQALMGMLAANDKKEHRNFHGTYGEAVSEACYGWADAMLKARSKANE